MLTYNTHLKPLQMPEYGRNLQNMVDYCLTIEDRDVRTACASSIAKAMETLFPGQGDKTEYRKKIWSHIGVMSGFKLDVDSPYPMDKPEEMDSAPNPLPRPEWTKAGTMSYGSIIPRLIDDICEMEPGPKRHELTVLVASQMKKLMLGYNPEGVDDNRIFADIYRISKGRLRINPDEIILRNFQVAPAPQTGKKKKKK